MKKTNPIVLLMRWSGKDSYYLYLSILLSFVSGLASIFPYLSLYKIMDSVLQNELSRSIVIYNVMLIATSIIIKYLFFSLSTIASHKGAYNALFRVRILLINHMALIPLGSLNERNTGEIKTLLNEEIEKLELFLAHSLPDLVLYLTAPIVIFIYLASINLQLSLLSLLPLVCAIIILFLMFKSTNNLVQRAFNSISELNTNIIEYVNGMKVIKAFNMTTKSFHKYRHAVNHENDLWIETSKRMGPLFSMYIIVIECGIVLMIPFGCLYFLNGAISATELILFGFVGSLYLSEIRPLQDLGSTFANVLSVISSTEAILDIQPYSSTETTIDNYNIELKNVSFAYTQTQPVLNNVNLSIREKEKIAIVGASGAGKSTIFKLIARFYDVDQGEVLIGQKNIKKLNYEKLLENISIVFQQSFLTRNSVFDNIVMASNATYEEVVAAAKQAQIHDFIISLPDGYDTLVGSHSTRFSGGEKQRIAIARAILKNSPILILDEATSASDPENQLKLDQAIYNLCQDKTVIIIAHRLSIALKCDRIAVVTDNTITDYDTHDNLLLNSEYYQKAWYDYTIARDITFSRKGSVTNE